MVKLKKLSNNKPNLKSMRLHTKSLLFFFVLSSSSVHAGITNIEISDPTIDTIDLLLQSQYFIDKTNQLKVEDLTDKDFVDSDGGYRIFAGKNYWARFQITNNTNDTLRPYLIDKVSFAELYECENSRCKFLGYSGSATTEKGAVLTSHSIGFVLLPGESRDYYFKMENFLTNRNASLNLIFPENIPHTLAAYNEKAKNSQSKYNVFMGILIFICFISTIQYFVSKILPFKYYACYLAACILMYLKYLDWLFGFAGALEADLYYLAYQVESIAAYLMTIGYILFVRHFLKLEESSPLINRGLSYVLNFHVFLIGVDLFLRWWYGHQLAFQIFTYARVLVFPLMILLVIFFLFNLKEKLYRFIILGTFLFMVPMLSTLAKHVFQTTKISHHFLYSCDSYFGVKLCLYNSRSGILLEIICFFIGLGYLLKKEQEEKKYFENLAIASQKQIDELNLSQAEKQTSKTLESNKKGRTKISLPSREGYHLVGTNQILYCAADGNMCTVYLKNGKKKMVAKTLKEIASLLPQDDFIRIHASHMVNKDSIVRYIRGEGGLVVLINDEELKVSRSRKEELLTRLNIVKF